MNAILIEDRTERRRQFTEISGIDLLRYSFLKICEGDEFLQIKSDIKNQEFQQLKNFNLILSHKSALSLNEQDTLVKYCRDQRIPLVFFSGGISSSFLDESGTPILNINSKDFYSNKLDLFLSNINNDFIELSILQFGEKWQLNLMLKAREELAKKIYNLPNVNAYIEPEDLQSIFTPKVIESFNSSDLRNILETMLDFGIKSDVLQKLNSLRQTIDRIIKEKIGIFQ